MPCVAANEEKGKKKRKQYIRVPPIKDLYRLNEEVFLSVPCTMGENNITEPIQNLDKVHGGAGGGRGECRNTLGNSERVQALKFLKATILKLLKKRE